MARGAMTHRLAAGQRATVALRRVIEPCACGAGQESASVAKKSKASRTGRLCFLAQREGLGLTAATKRRGDFAFSPRLGQSRLWRSPGSPFTTAPVRIPPHARQKNKSASRRGSAFVWRRGRDSNPRVVSHKLISSQPRYDRFDTSAYIRSHALGGEPLIV